MHGHVFLMTGLLPKMRIYFECAKQGLIVHNKIFNFIAVSFVKVCLK